MRRLAVLVVLCAAGVAHAQSINISFGHISGGPSSTYAAAGAAGTWNNVMGIAGPSADHLLAIDGSTTSISVSQSPTTTVLSGGDTSVTGDDAALLDSGLVTTGAETCLSFSGFEAGTYEVLIYAWVPNAPSVLSLTRQDEAPSKIPVGGAWTGAHAEGVTYARYVVTVDSSGNLPAHSGLDDNMPSAALNGIQIRPLDAVPPDAGATGGGGGGGGETDDAGITSGGHHGGGCAVGGGAPGLLVVLAFALVRRQRR
ncbi:MAG TPA: hypothetical protein VMJ10_07055 [Kofleriaceae bacterium]|nr:hypothetical protein [Kofleriaceae bacterium]